MNKKINLLYCIDSSAIGGAEIHLLHLVKNIDTKQFATTVICPTLKELDSWAKQLKKYSNVVRHNTGIFSQLFLRKVYRKADIIHFHLPSPYNCLFGLVGAKLAKARRIVVTEHMPRPVHSKYPFKTNLVNFNFKHIDKVITVSEASARILQKTFSVDPSKIVTVYNGIDTSLYRPCSKEDIIYLKKTLNIDANVHVVGAIGRLTEQKGFEFLIKAASYVICKIANIKFLIMGTGELESKLKHLVKEYKVQDNFFFLGYREDIHNILPIFDVFVLPSLWEAFPLTILEAMATAKPVVASSVGGIDEAVENGETGLLVPPKDSTALADAIIFLLEDKEKALEMGKKGRERVEKYFSIDLMIENTKKIYFELLS